MGRLIWFIEEKHNDNRNDMGANDCWQYLAMGGIFQLYRGVVMFGRKHKKNAQDMAWLMRATFEVAWREAGGDPEKWRDAWKESRPRATLVAMGYIKDEDGFR